MGAQVICRRIMFLKICLFRIRFVHNVLTFTFDRSIFQVE